MTEYGFRSGGPRAPRMIVAVGAALTAGVVALGASPRAAHDDLVVGVPLHLGAGSDDDLVAGVPLHLGAGSRDDLVVGVPLHVGAGTHDDLVAGVPLHLGAGSHDDPVAVPGVPLRRLPAADLLAGQAAALNRVTGSVSRDVERLEVLIDESQRVIVELQAALAGATSRQAADEVAEIRDRLARMRAQLTEYTATMDIARVARAAELQVAEQVLTSELKGLRRSLDELTADRHVAEQSYTDLSRRQLELRRARDGGAMRLDDLLDDVQARRSRLMDIEIERAVVEATIQFLRDQMVTIMDRIEAGMANDVVLERMRKDEAEFPALVKEGLVSTRELTNMIDRRMEREYMLASRLGQDLVRTLETRLIDAELEAMTLKLKEAFIRGQIERAMAEATAIGEADQLGSLQLPVAAARFAASDEQLRVLQVQLAAVEDRLLQISKERQRLSESAGGRSSGSR